MLKIKQKQAIDELLSAGVTSRADLMSAKRKLAKKYY